MKTRIKSKWPYKKYHIVSYHHTENGYDGKMDYDTLVEAKREAKRLLYHDNDNYRWYEKMFITCENGIVMVFDENYHDGRKPYSFEQEDFNFDCYKPVLDNRQLLIDF